MKKLLVCTLAILMMVIFSGFTLFDNNSDDFDINDLYDYQKEYKSEEISLCSANDAKTYMDYRMTTVVSSNQYQFLNYECTVDKKTGFLYDEEGFIAVALGSYFGKIGDRFYFTLDSGVVLPLVKGEEKDDGDTDGTNCYHTIDGSVIEFVIHDEYAADYFGANGNGYVLNGNYNNYPLFEGSIVKVERVLDEKNDKLVTYQSEQQLPVDIDIFNYASGY